MNSALSDIPRRIRDLAVGALSQANTHAVFEDPGTEHWQFMSVLNTAHAGELFLKAIIAKEHPLLIFRDLFTLNDSTSAMIDVDDLIRRGKTHDFDKLPQVLWVTTGKRVPNMQCFERLRQCRNAVQHFCAPENEDLQSLSLEFIYTIIDPLIAEAFELCAIEFHEDPGGFYDYVVQRVIAQELKFTLPPNFDLGEINLAECLSTVSQSYRNWFASELTKIGKIELIDRAR